MRVAERKRKLQREMRRIYRVLKTHGIDVEMRWLFEERDLYGDYDVDRHGNGQIRIDPFKEMVGTLVHEIYHHLEPKARHTRIVALEDFIIRSASPRQLLHLFGYLVLRWRMTLTDRRPHRAMPLCPLCGRRLPRVPGSRSGAASQAIEQEEE